MRNKKKLSYFILDVDGVMTTGQFIYTNKGKSLKIFGPDDNDGLSLLSPYIKIQFVTGDKTGYKITKKRIVDDMNYKLNLVSTVRRVEWIKKNFKIDEVIYMGDGIFDHYVMRSVKYSIAPSNADQITKKKANYVCKRQGGDRAVAEACLHILKKFFKAFDPNSLPPSKIKLSGNWSS